MIIECNETHISELNKMLSYFHVTLTKENMEDNPFIHYFAYVVDSEMVGFISYSILYERAELNYIYVKTEYRGSKVGTLLLENMFEKCNSVGVKNITLEVRESNIAAIKLYESKGFETVAKRSNYYQSEDGLLMEKVL